MPELPEVETVARDLRDALLGRRFERVEATHPKIVRFPAPEVFCQHLMGRRVDAVDRWGKFIIVLGNTRRQLKAVLFDQARVAGLGNIYIDEACHRAGVRPQRRCHRLTPAQRRTLHDAIQSVLTEAVRNRGSSVDNYRDVWNAKGRHQEALQVYGRAGQPCLRCGAVLRKVTLAQRTTVFCPGCQR